MDNCRGVPRVKKGNLCRFVSLSICGSRSTKKIVSHSLFPCWSNELIFKSPDEGPFFGNICMIVSIISMQFWMIEERFGVGIWSGLRFSIKKADLQRTGVIWSNCRSNVFVIVLPVLRSKYEKSRASCRCTLIRHELDLCNVIQSFLMTCLHLCDIIDKLGQCVGMLLICKTRGARAAAKDM